MTAGLFILKKSSNILTKMADINSYQTRITPTWCPGCGNFGIIAAIKKSLSDQNLAQDGVLFVYDVGCSSNMADFLNPFGIHALHGRTIPVAVGAHLADHQFPILAIGGDGGVYGEGVEHFIEACRGNFNITVIVHNNTLYSLTTGQRSPTSEKGKKTKSTPFGVLEVPFSPLKTAIMYQAGFVARGYALDSEFLTKLITAGIKHPGFSLIDVLQPCLTFNKEMTPDWYKQRVYQLPSFEGLSIDQALKLVDQDPDKLATGVFYRSSRPAYHDQLSQIKKLPLLKQSINSINISQLIDDFR